jgi:AcrR family transcriptional regulator
VSAARATARGAETARRGRRRGSGKRSAREQILDAAVERIASDGIDDVRIARIAMDAGVSTSLVHYHFESREALLAEALEHSFELAGDVRIGEGEGEAVSHAHRLATMVDQCLPYPGSLERDWILWVELWLRAARRPELRPTAARLYERMHRWFADAISDGVAAGEFADCDVDALTDRALAMLDGFGIRALVRDPAVSLDWARGQVWRVLAEELRLDAEPAPPSSG